MQCFHKRRHAEEDAQPREQHPQKQDTVAHAKKKQKHAATSRASQAAALSAQAHTHRLQITVCTQFARVLSAADTCTIKERADKIAAQLAEDSKRSIPLLNFSFQLESGGLLLTAFIKFLVTLCAIRSDSSDMKQLKTSAWTVLKVHFTQINTLLSQKPQPYLYAHKEERGAVALLAGVVIPLSANHFLVHFARSLLTRGACINARTSQGYTPLQNWCYSKVLTSAGCLLVLLDAGADLDMSHPTGQTVLANLISHKSVQVLRELSDAGWLMSANLSVPGPNGEMPMQQLQRMSSETPSDTDLVEMRDILAAQKTYWTQHARPAVVAELGVHEQLVPELAELIASYVA